MANPGLLECGCPTNDERFWRNWAGNEVIGCVRHPPPEPDKPKELLNMEQEGVELMKNAWTGDQADIFLKENPDHDKITGSRAIPYIWKNGGKLVAYYVRSETRTGWIYKKR